MTRCPTTPRPLGTLRSRAEIERSLKRRWTANQRREARLRNRLPLDVRVPIMVRLAVRLAERNRRDEADLAAHDLLDGDPRGTA